MEDVKVVKIGDKEYTFELNNRRLIRDAETRFGFSLLKVETELIDQSYRLWVAGLNKNHNNLSIDAREDLYDKMKEEGNNPLEVVNYLIDKVTSFVNPTQANTKKAKTKE